LRGITSYVLWAGAAGFVASVGLVRAARDAAGRRRLLDHPNERSLHGRPTPRGGGVGIVVPVCLSMGVVAVLVPGVTTAAAWLACLGALIAAVGLVDDIRGLAAGTRLLAQVAAGVLVVVGIGGWRTLVWPGLGSLDLGWATGPFTVLLVVGLTNAYNFMDGADGIAGIQGVVAGVGWIGAGYTTQEPLLAAVGAVIALSCLGFLLFNWSPGSIFMGDVGSYFLGFSMAALSVAVAPRWPATATAGILFVWPFLFDTAFTFARRAGRGENVLTAHRSHLYQRLVLSGVPHSTVALLYGALAAVGVLVGEAVAREVRSASVAGVVLIAALAAGLWLVVIWREHAVRAGGGSGQG
jgi:UDP-N-acetylmuramyl pentapeptide phosphotransferase/UDP-N-acetylglucosamine-1-phosphate transferase